MLPTLRFLVVFEALGLMGIPLARLAFARLPGVGIGFARMLAWLLLAWLVWMLSSLGIPNGRLLVFACVALLGAGAYLAHRRLGPAEPDPFRRRLFITGEILFVVSFLAAVFVNAYGADVVGPTEKPMDMMLLSSTLASSDMPPADPWLAGETVNYYYLGHHMVAMVVRLIGVEPSAGYNLGLAAVFAMMVTTAFAASATLAEAARRQGLAIRRPLLAGGLGVTLLALMASWRGGWTALHPNGPWAAYDYFAPSRVIPNAINEWPFFSWTVGDLHGHFIAVPVTMLAVGFIVQAGIAGLPRLRSLGGALETFAAALSVGWLYGVNSWSWPVMAGLFVVTVVVWMTTPAAAEVRGRALAWGVGVVVLGMLLVLPFILSFEPNAKGFELTEVAQREPFGVFAKHHFEIEGPLLWLLVAPFIAALLRHRHRLRIAVWGGAALALILPALGGDNLIGAGVTLMLTFAALAVSVSRGRGTGERVLWVLAAAGLGCLFLSELVVVRDEFANGQYERMNTIFKMGYQAWLLLAVFGAVALAAAREWAPRLPRLLWAGVATFLIGVSTTYVFVGTAGRKKGFHDGPRIEGRKYLAPSDIATIDYVREKLPGDAVILEAFGDDYSTFGNARISTFTGRPTIVGWQGHELQWKHSVNSIVDPATLRSDDVKLLYNSPDSAKVRTVLKAYNVSYAVFGPLEQTTYGSMGALASLVTPVFSSGATTLYKVI